MTRRFKPKFTITNRIAIMLTPPISLGFSQKAIIRNNIRQASYPALGLVIHWHTKPCWKANMKGVANPLSVAMDRALCLMIS